MMSWSKDFGVSFGASAVEGFDQSMLASVTDLKVDYEACSVIPNVQSTNAYGERRYCGLGARYEAQAGVFILA